MATVFNEWYGEIPVALNRAIKKYNVSPSDFQTLEHYGLSHNEMLDAIKRHSIKHGMFMEYDFIESQRGW